MTKEHSGDYLLKIIEEQVVVEFTGKINLLERSSRQFLGVIVLLDGKVWHVKYRNSFGLKAFFEMFIHNLEMDEILFVVEPEIVDKIHQNIPYPYKVLIAKLSMMMTEYEQSKKDRPPKELKLLINPQFLSSTATITDVEYEILLTLCDYNVVEEVYKHCPLVDFQITNGLVSLRNKNALKTVS